MMMLSVAIRGAGIDLCFMRVLTMDSIFLNVTLKIKVQIVAMSA